MGLPPSRRERALRDPRAEELRVEVLEALAQLGDWRAIPEVERVMESDPDPRVRQYARSTRSTLQGEQQMDELRRMWREQGRR